MNTKTFQLGIAAASLIAAAFFQHLGIYLDTLFPLAIAIGSFFTFRALFPKRTKHPLQKE